MTLLINNTETKTSATTLAELLKEQQINPNGIAVAVEQRIISKAEWESHKLCENDNITIIKAFYGG